MAAGTDSAFAGGNRAAITACAIIATLMQALDTTIANVALPYMQGSVSASQDQIDWVLTSYIVAAAIMTPPTGFLAGRFGLKNLFLASITGFTVTSMLCGMAQTVTQIVLFRVLQGAFGAALVPLSQTVLLNTYPRERQGFAMALFGMGAMVGPIIGPTLGGWLTENFDWRWVFLINVLPGIVTLIGFMLYLPEVRRSHTASSSAASAPAASPKTSNCSKTRSILSATNTRRRCWRCCKPSRGFNRRQAAISLT